MHLNFPFDEPLKPDTKLGDLFDGGLAPAPANDAAHGLVQPQGHISGAAAADMARTLQANDALLLAGEGSCATIEDAKAVMEFARAFAMPVLADPLSGLRC